MKNQKYINKIENCCHRFPRSYWDRGIGFHGLTKTAGFDSAVSLRPRNLNFANDYLDFLGENEAICKTALGRESGDCLMKKPRVENLVTLSL
jgi:hypothetical protein